MCCRGVHRIANPAFLRSFLCSGLQCVAQCCAPGGVRVVSISLSYLPSTEGSPEPVLRPLSQDPTYQAPCQPQPLASPPGASPASCKDSEKKPGNRSPPRRVSVSEPKGCPDRPLTLARPSSGG